MKLASIALAACAVLGLAACHVDPPSANEVEAAATEKSNAEAVAEIGMPNIRYHTEKRLAVHLAELRDKPNLVTYTYVSGIDGKKICVGKSIGYGLPYATQITNPEAIQSLSSTSSIYMALPQSEPNGLYSPPTADATWVILVGPDGQPSPFYEEQKISVSLFPLPASVVSVRGTCV